MYRFNIPKWSWLKINFHNQGYQPSCRTDHSCVGFGSSIYVFGGFDGKSRFNDLWRYKIDTNFWEEVGWEHPPMGRFGHTWCMYQQSMFVFGGWNGHDTLDDLTEFSTTTNQWFPVTGRGHVPSSRYRHSAIVYGCCMFVFGGVDKRQ